MNRPPRPTTGRHGQAWWDDRYVTGLTGWDHLDHAPLFARTIARLDLPLCRALDLGCGRGRNSRFLARQGFSMVGVDISGVAIKGAVAEQGELDCEFHHIDVLADPIPGGPFGAVFDYGCWHVFDEDEHRAMLARKLADVLEPGGLWIAMVGSTDGPPRQMGPPRRSARDIVVALEPHFEIVELVRNLIDPEEDPIRPVWEVVVQRRAG